MAELDIADLKAEWGNGSLHSWQQGSNPDTGRDLKEGDGRGEGLWHASYCTRMLSSSHASHSSSLDPIDETSFQQDMQALLGSLMVMCPC